MKDDATSRPPLSDGGFAEPLESLELVRSEANLFKDWSSAPRVATVITYAIIGWGWVELPWEIGPMDAPPEIAALVASNCLLSFSACLTLNGVVWAKGIFVLICVLSLLAVVPGLSVEYGFSPPEFLLSTVECVLRFSWLLVVGIGNVRFKSRGSR
jgi:hypothetical protein